MPLKRSIFIVFALLCVVGLLIYNFGFTDILVGIYSFSSFSFVYFLAKFLFPTLFSKITQKLRQFLGIKSKRAKKLVPEYTFDKKQFVLNNLKDQVYKLCEAPLRIIEETEVKYIRKLHWKYHKATGEIIKLSGALSEVVPAMAKFGPKSFVVYGKPGVGKTSAIYEYLKTSLESLDNTAEKEEKDLVPVYFSLSSWKKNQSIKEWLIQEFKRIYHVDKIPAEYFLSKHKVFPFLDGLDQMGNDYREKCFFQIYQYTRHNPLGITSRPDAFKESIAFLKKKKINTQNIFNVFELRPLSLVQVRDITKQLPTKDTFQELFDKSPRLKSLARYPMVLQIICIIIEDLDAKDIASFEQEDDRSIFNKLWKKYDAHIFKTDQYLNYDQHPYTPKKMRNWLKNMAHQDDAFFIEELQPLFLSTKLMRLNYYLLSRILGAFLLSVAAGFFMSDPFDFWGAALISAFTIVSVIWLSRSYKRKKGKEIFTNLDAALRYKKNTSLGNSLGAVFLFLIPLIISLGAYFGFSTPRSPEFAGELQLNGLFSITEAIVGLLIAILMGLFFGIRSRWQKVDIDIRSVERIRRDWRNFFKYGILGGLSLGLFLIPLLYIFKRMTGNSIFNIWLQEKLYIENSYLFAFCAGAGLGFFLIGLTGYLNDNDTLLAKSKKKAQKSRPNFGIRKSFKNALKSGFLSIIVMTLLFGTVIGGLEGEITSTIKAVKVGIAFGILGFVWFGGLDVLSHYVLRALVFLDNSGPLNYTRFLEEAAHLRFIKAVGSGYEFTHPTLKDYFAQEDFGTLKRKSLKKWVVPLFCFIVSIPLAYSIFQRFYNDPHWSDPHGFEINLQTPYLRKVSGKPQMLVAQNIESGALRQLQFNAQGRIRTGTFVGYVSAGGTEAAFLGMGIGNTYDYPELYPVNHGALAISKKGTPKWHDFPEEDVYGLFETQRKLLLNISNSDTLVLKINDREWQNNTGKFLVKVMDVPKTRKKMHIISHRGAAGLAPENSLEAIQKGLALGADKIEIDIHQTQDGTLVLMHDKKVNRTTNGKGFIKNQDFNTLRSLELKTSQGNTDLPLRIPSLKEVLELVRPYEETKLLIEVKNSRSYPGLAKNLVDLIKAYNLTNRVEILSFDQKFIQEFKKTYPEFYTGIFVFGPLDYNTIKGIDAIGVYYHSLLLFPSFQKKLREKGYQIYAWNVNSQRSMQRLLDQEIDAIITDYPDVLKTAMGR
ncbi:glycerophosphodiester phosphodiesterase family protein [Spongiimicrobium salis]|uniref:glycerophosphodiester phosphodiesterase family protein n=1 Tax=Spongiimicrobium salis TaxID=1667022 RepID=UPI00374D3A89